MNALYKKNIFITIFFLFITAVYLHNMTRDIYSGDMGDLVTAACIWGVPHPSGYPLLTFLGNILCHLPLPMAPVAKVALLSVGASVAGLILYYKLVLHFTKSLFISLLSTVILALSYLFWIDAEIPEVFALNNFFVIAILYFSILFYAEKKPWQLYLTALFTGLSITHHQTIIFVFPAMLILVLKHYKLLLKDKKLLYRAIMWGAIGLLPYLYVPLAASHNPVINWDSASNLKNFIHLFLRKDYGTAPSLINQIPYNIKLIQVSDFFKTLVLLFSYQIIFLVILGVVQLFKKYPRMALALLTAFFLAGPFYVYYGAGLITTVQAWAIVERFYSMAAVILMFFAPFGLLMIKSFLDKRFSSKIYSLILLSYFIIIPVLLLRFNFPKTDLSKTKIGNTLANNILLPLPQNAILFLSGDTTTFNTWYAHYILKVRPDINIINSPGVGGNNYLDEKINEYHKKNPQVPLKQISGKTIIELTKQNQVFATLQIASLPPELALVPIGLVNELMSSTKIPSENNYLSQVEANLHKIKVQRRETLTIADENLITLEMPLIYSNALVRIGDFVDSHYKDPVQAEHYYRRALWIDPTNPSAYSGLSIVQFKGFKDCPNSISSMKLAIENYPIWMGYYKQLFYIYTQCKVDNSLIQNLKKDYQNRFGSSIDAK